MRNYVSLYYLSPPPDLKMTVTNFIIDSSLAKDDKIVEEYRLQFLIVDPKTRNNIFVGPT